MYKQGDLKTILTERMKNGQKFLFMAIAIQR